MDVVGPFFCKLLIVYSSGIEFVHVFLHTDCDCTSTRDLSVYHSHSLLVLQYLQVLRTRSHSAAGNLVNFFLC